MAHRSRPAAGRRPHPGRGALDRARRQSSVVAQPVADLTSTGRSAPPPAERAPWSAGRPAMSSRAPSPRCNRERPSDRGPERGQLRRDIEVTPSAVDAQPPGERIESRGPSPKNVVDRHAAGRQPARPREPPNTAGQAVGGLADPEQCEGRRTHDTGGQQPTSREARTVAARRCGAPARDQQPPAAWREMHDRERDQHQPCPHVKGEHRPGPDREDAPAGDPCEPRGERSTVASDRIPPTATRRQRRAATAFGRDRATFRATVTASAAASRP